VWGGSVNARKIVKARGAFRKGGGKIIIEERVNGPPGEVTNWESGPSESLEEVSAGKRRMNQVKRKLLRWALNLDLGQLRHNNHTILGKTRANFDSKRRPRARGGVFLQVVSSCFAVTKSQKRTTPRGNCSTWT